MGPEHPFADVFLAALGGSSCAALPELEELLAECAEAARATWPNIALDIDLFLSHLADKVRGAASPLPALRAIQSTDLYLACACARGDRKALEIFETRYLPQLQPALAHLELGATQIDEAKQWVRQHVLVAKEDGAPPLIAQYSGRGKLEAWLKVVAIRAVMQVIRRKNVEVPTDEEDMEILLPPTGDPELRYLKDVYREEFKLAFKQALESLPPRDLNVLRHHYSGGLTTTEIAGLYHVHQVTVSRWLEKARQAILVETQRLLTAKLQLNPGECESILRLVQSNLAVTLRSFFPK
jgi:RNA polymerase sigma-70 factor (ECF subfamily)